MRKLDIHPPVEILSSTSDIQIAVVDHYAGNPRFLEKALALFRADPRIDITIDLEDGAALGNESARAFELAKILSSQNIRSAGIRIHSLDSPYWLSDLEIFFKEAAKYISHVTIPKVEDPQALKAAIHIINELRSIYGNRTEQPNFGVRILIESAAAIQNLFALSAVQGVQGLDFGIMDFVSSYDGSLSSSCMQSPQQFMNPVILHAKNQITSVARSRGISAAHNVTIKLKPISTARRDARIAKSLGFTRMWSVHPEQAKEIIAGFAATRGERALALKVLKKAQTCGWGPVRVDEKLYDRASYRWLWRLLNDQ